MSKNIKGFRIKGQVYPINGSGAGNNLVCLEDLYNYMNGKVLDVEALINFISSNFSNQFIESGTRLIIGKRFNRNSSNEWYKAGIISIEHNYGSGNAAYNYLGNDYPYNLPNQADTILEVLLDSNNKNYIESTNIYLHDCNPQDANSSGVGDIYNLYVYLGYDDSSFTWEYAPISFAEFISLFKDSGVQTE